MCITEIVLHVFCICFAFALGRFLSTSTNAHSRKQMGFWPVVDLALWT